MKHMWNRALGIVFLGALAGLSNAQTNWGVICVDPMNTAPRSTDYATNTVLNDLMLVRMGLSGTVTYGGATGPCFAPGVTIPIAGKFAISYGLQGSIQRYSQNFVDDLMAITFGAFQDPAWCYAATSKEGVKTRWGSNGIGTAFVGFSNRYMSATSTNDNIRAKLQVELVGDAARFRWTLTNLDTASANIGLWFGGSIAMLTSGSGFSGDSRSGFMGTKLPYFYVPNGRPLNTDTSFDKTLNPTAFPAYVDMLFGETDNFGIRIENGPSDATADVSENSPSEASNMWIGKSNFLLGDIADNAANFPVAMLPDTDGLTAFVQQFPDRPVPAGGTIQILHYVRSNWGASDYKLPYGVTVDAPRVIGTPRTDFNGNLLNGNIFPNPFQMRVYVDNVGGYGFDGKEFPLNDVRVKVKFAPTSGVTVTGSSASTPYELEKTIPVVLERDNQFINFSASVGPNVSGVVPYTVEIHSQPGNVVKTIKSSIIIAARPRIQLTKDANLITLPFTFTDTSLDAVLGNFIDPVVPGGDFQAYKWDPIQQGYVIVNSVTRGQGFWLVYNNTAGATQIQDLLGNPSLTGTQLATAPLVQTNSGFNMIGNPYNYPIPINQVLGVNAANPQVSHTFREMVELGYVQSFLTTWDPVLKDYVYVDAENGVLEPHRGYWLRVLTADDITLNYPAVFIPGTPEQTRKPGKYPTTFVQSDSQWRLQFAARTNEGMDAQNFVGQAANVAAANHYRTFEPPQAPTQVIGLSVMGTLNGAPAKMAQSLSETKGRHEWTLKVDAKKAGDVTVTWPNLATVPKNVRFRITDKATGVSRFLRQSSGYTFHMEAPGSREFTVTSEVGGATAAVIGNVVVSQPGNGKAPTRNAPFTIAYTLSSDATTSVRILSASGKEVYTASRGRADRSGENSVVWNLRNNANQSVAPGAYRVEIVAETAAGERIRKVIPVNVIR